MGRKPIGMIVFVMTCGLAVSIGIIQLVAMRGAKPHEEQGNTENVFVTLEDVGFGEPLTTQVLAIESWPSNRVM